MEDKHTVISRHSKDSPESGSFFQQYRNLEHTVRRDSCLPKELLRLPGNLRSLECTLVT